MATHLPRSAATLQHVCLRIYPRSRSPCGRASDFILVLFWHLEHTRGASPASQSGFHVALIPATPWNKACPLLEMSHERTWPSFSDLAGAAALIRSCLCSSVSDLCLALPCVQGANASGLVAVALSALPTGLTPAVPSARAGAASATGSALPHCCASMPQGSTSLASTSAIMNATQRRLRSPGLPKRICESSNANTPSDFSGSSTRESGCFKRSRW